GKEHGVVAIPHPYIAIGRIDQSEIGVPVEPVLAAPECHRQGLAIDPALVVPAAGLHIVLPVVAVPGVTIDFVGARVEALLVLLPLGRLMARLIGRPVVMRVLCMRLAILLAPLLPVLRLPVLGLPVLRLPILLAPLLPILRLAIGLISRLAVLLTALWLVLGLSVGRGLQGRKLRLPTLQVLRLAVLGLAVLGLAVLGLAVLGLAADGLVLVFLQGQLVGRNLASIGCGCCGPGDGGEEGRCRQDDQPRPRCQSDPSEHNRQRCGHCILPP